jgi:hypothetical protein
MRMFPQSVYMRKPKRIQETYDSFTSHPDLQLGARDQPSYDWLHETFGPSEKNGEEGTRVKYSCRRISCLPMATGPTIGSGKRNGEHSASYTDLRGHLKRG